jgi:DNA primase
MTNKWGIDVRELLGTDGRFNSRRTEYITKCPFCGKESHFYVNVHTLRFSCKKCWEEGGVYKLLSQFDKLYLLEGATIEEREVISKIRDLTTSASEDVKLEPLPPRKMPVGYKVCFHDTYLERDRGLTPDVMKRYAIGRTKLVRRYADYILIPVTTDGVITAFQGRYASKKVPPDALRWRNDTGADFAKMLYGYDDIKAPGATVILVEGVFDKIAVDRRLRLDDCDDVKCCATFGKKISDYQRAMLQKKGVRAVVLLYDFDAIKEIKKYAFELDKYFSTNIVFTTKKDIDECNEAETLEVFERLQRPRDFAWNVIGKLKR